MSMHELRSYTSSTRIVAQCGNWRMVVTLDFQGLFYQSTQKYTSYYNPLTGNKEMGWEDTNRFARTPASNDMVRRWAEEGAKC